MITFVLCMSYHNEKQILMSLTHFKIFTIFKIKIQSFSETILLICGFHSTFIVIPLVKIHYFYLLYDLQAIYQYYNRVWISKAGRTQQENVNFKLII